MTDPDADVSNLSDLEVELRALELATPLAASNFPASGNFYSAQHAPGSATPWPPFPGNIFQLSAWPLDTNIFVLDDLNFDYNTANVTAKTLTTANAKTVEADVEGPPSPPGGGGSGTNSDNPTPQANLLPDFGTNLFITQFGMVSGNLTGIATNTIADVSYAIQTNGDLTQTTNWADTGQFILGSETTNWTQFILPPPLSTNNLFFRLQSELSSDGSGIPSWWELKYLGQDTNVDPYADPTSDGWTLLEDYEDGWNPNSSRPPPAPQLTASFNDFSNSALLSWMTALTPATSFTVVRIETFYGNVVSNVFNLSGSVNSLQDTPPDADAYITEWGARFDPFGPDWHLLSDSGALCGWGLGLESSGISATQYARLRHVDCGAAGLGLFGGRQRAVRNDRFAIVAC
jgi:hypothetical protein